MTGQHILSAHPVIALLAMANWIRWVNQRDMFQRITDLAFMICKLTKKVSTRTFSKLKLHRPRKDKVSVLCIGMKWRHIRDVPVPEVLYQSCWSWMWHFAQNPQWLLLLGHTRLRGIKKLFTRRRARILMIDPAPATGKFVWQHFNVSLLSLFGHAVRGIIHY